MDFAEDKKTALPPDDQFRLNIWKVLCQIEEFRLLYGNSALFSFTAPDWDESKITEHNILGKLQTEGYIKDYKLDGGTATFDLIQPKFNELYKSYKRRFYPRQRPQSNAVADTGALRIGDTAHSVASKRDDSMQGKKPYTFAENGIGYFKFNKQGKRIDVGEENSRHFRLLQCLCEPLGAHKLIEAVFEAIRLPEDGADRQLQEFSSERKTRMLTKIENAIKELQKNEEFQEGRLRFKYDRRKKEQRKYMWLEVEG